MYCIVQYTQMVRYNLQASLGLYQNLPSYGAVKFLVYRNCPAADGISILEYAVIFVPESKISDNYCQPRMINAMPITGGTY